MASGLLGTTGLRLPNELALLVIDHLADDNKELCTLARTCRGMQHLAEERIYKTIELLSVKDLHAIIEAFTRRHDRVRAVQTLKILYQYRPGDLNDSEEARTRFNECVAHMINLREWHIESPYDNFNWAKAGGHEWVERDMMRFQGALEAACVDGPKEAERMLVERRMGKNIDRTVGLALLETLTIHSHGAAEDFWALDGFDCLFRHPTLRTLHISCVSLPAEGLPSLVSHVNKTPLTTLIFDECELEPKSLKSILRTPARLKHLTLGENVFNVNRSRRPNPKLSKKAGASFEALAAVAHSLESLTHLDPGWRTDFSPHVLRSIRPPGEGMRNFHSLKYLECDTSSFLHQGAIMNRDLAPPNLETLRLRRHWEVAVDFWDQPPAADHYAALPSLKTLELLQSSFIWFELSLPDYICQADRIRNRHACAYKLSKAGINLKMSIEMHRDPKLIPPYLHGELIPIVHCIYDASVVGFHRHISETCNVANDVADYPGIDHSPSDIHVFASREPTPPIEYKGIAELSAAAAPDKATAIGIATEDAPETDQLSDADIHRLTGETRRALQQLKLKFIRQRRSGRASSVLSFIDDDDDDDDDSDGLDDEEDFEVDDLDEDADMDLELELDEDGFEDEDGIQIYEHNGQLYIEVYEPETDDEDEEDEAMEGVQSTNDDLD
ncbi:uncharacterized protein K460DRAFT_64915 [Cucurbitaria berberidis CBS 394.84]|uniref:F-box domain-containing protein n=1 Tax=Cucurbitaria berberidis CBS 394.84 TaxID=1168544 RepID=A0A9P4LAU8_9PLEO|nr:uncharacterized protein K460DRAFT_64915 [Cucurbitaria berberidis CBS 394.84]KAF1847868.1 hypothetical protein K460DRAFT_64915 [Cucurbitaria berberidis CBS 394.84]